MSSASSGVREARRIVAQRLRHLRQDAELTGRDLAVLCGWHPAKASRIENARTRPSDEDIRTWCRACGSEGEAADLISASRTADSMYREWRELQRTGMTRNQTADMPLYQRTRHMRVYCSNVIPGLLQTQGYAEALLGLIAEVFDTPNDAPDAAAARIERSKVLYDGTKRFAFLVEEDVLYFPFGDDEVVAGQLGYLMAVMALPSVSLGVIPRTAKRRMWPLEGFLAFDSTRVQVETLSANIIVSRRSETTLYLQAFERLSKMAVYGPQARALILQATPEG